MLFLPPLSIEQEIKLEIKELKAKNEIEPSRVNYLKLIELTEMLIMLKKHDAYLASKNK